MEHIDNILQINTFMTVTIGIIVLFVGKRLNDTVKFLREFGIPEAVSGGLLFSLIWLLFYLLSGISVEFDMQARDILLIYFFTTIGINASFSDLLRGGKPLALLLVLTLGYMFLQNFAGIGIASLFELPKQVGLLGGSISLIGGHGTAIAWAPRLAEDYGIANAMEIGVASATFGLVLASTIGGPIAKFLIQRHRLQPKQSEPLDVGLPSPEGKPQITYLDFLDAVLAIHISIILGLFLNELLENAGLKLPLFVSCLFAGIVITNLMPKSFPRVSGRRWPVKEPAMALIADISLGTFMAMSLMSMQLWELMDLAGPMFAILFVQVTIVILFVLFIVFPAMGKNYQAAVISAGFAGYSMGATPTAIANMSAITKRYGASHMAFIIVPLVGAFFIDLSNAFIIQMLLN